MKSSITQICTVLVLILSNSMQTDAQSVLSWIWGETKNQQPSVVLTNDVPLISIPYDTLTEDEKFLKEAGKLSTDLQISSPLEICQHKVVLKIKSSCSSMTEEQLAKLSVNLLNCQSEIEGRQTFPCTDEMSIKQCTSNMDADTWNAYHLMSNRARAVCYAARSHQFRALTELTVNKLMQSAHTQIQTLSNLKESQDRLEEQTIAAHKIMDSNIQELTDEKALIRAGHSLLAEMTEDIRKKIEKASQDLMKQATERGENHVEILEDLEKIQTQAQQLFEKIESSTNRIIDQNLEAALQYEETLAKLEKINQTIVYVYDLTNSMRAEIDKKLGWITEYIGTTGENLEKIYRITLHIVYLFAAMIFAAFLQAPFLTRSAILGVVPLNLASYLKHGFSACLDFVSLSMLILLITAMHYVMNAIQYLIQSKVSDDKKNYNHNHHQIYTNGHGALNGNGKLYDDEHRKEKQTLVTKISNRVSNFISYINQQIHQSLENLKSTYHSTKVWVGRKFLPMEELSCSYLPKRVHEQVINGKNYPSISDDSSDYSDSRDSARFVIRDDNSLTGAVLRRKFADKPTISPLAAGFLHVNYEPKIRETILISKARDVQRSRSETPNNRPLCGAKTRSGNPCRNVSPRGQEYCHRHTSGSSVMGD